MEGYTVERISHKEVKPWLLEKHYAHRLPGSIMYAFALIKDSVVVGVMSFGMSPNMNLNKLGVYDVLELNRMVINKTNTRNRGSYFISKCFKLLPNPIVLVSYADEGQNHFGYIYQATNWIYTGTSKGQSLLIMSDGKTLHKRALDQQINNNTRKKEDIVSEIKSAVKHRYFYFIGSKKEKKQMRKALNYQALPYPKGESKRYDASTEFPRQIRMF